MPWWLATVALQRQIERKPAKLPKAAQRAWGTAWRRWKSTKSSVVLLLALLACLTA